MKLENDNKNLTKSTLGDSSETANGHNHDTNNDQTYVNFSFETFVYNLKLLQQNIIHDKITQDDKTMLKTELTRTLNLISPTGGEKGNGESHPNKELLEDYSEKLLELFSKKLNLSVSEN
ncbi:unnamed protein product [[Candida] boidinii]|nr:unnamed protein product [[Candida] boidinii]